MLELADLPLVPLCIYRAPEFGSCGFIALFVGMFIFLFRVCGTPGHGLNDPEQACLFTHYILDIPTPSIFPHPVSGLD